MLQRILQIILPVFAIVAAGWLYGRRHRPDTAAVNRMNMDIFVPALVLSALTSRDFDLWQNRGLILGSLGVVLGSGLLAWPVARFLRVDARTFVPPMMFNNCGNMGLPLALLAFGERWLPAAVALFVTSNLLHFTLGARMVRRDANVWGLLRSPMVLATAAGALLSALALRPPDWIALPLRMVGDGAVPLLPFALGVRLPGVALQGRQAPGRAPTRDARPRQRHPIQHGWCARWRRRAAGGTTAPTRASLRPARPRPPAR